MRIYVKKLKNKNNIPKKFKLKAMIYNNKFNIYNKKT